MQQCDLSMTVYYRWSNLEIYAIDISFYWIGSSYLNFSFILFFVKNCIMCVLLQFSVKRLLWNQSVISVITELMSFLNSSGLVFDIIMVISSANSIRLANLLMFKERSFIHIRNSNGPQYRTLWNTMFHMYPFRRQFIRFTIIHRYSQISIF